MSCVTASRRSMRRDDFRREALRHAMPWLATAVLLVIWEIACIVFDVPEIILPGPARSSHGCSWPASTS